MKPVPVICLAGPTGCGKTALAIELAGVWNCEIVNADSRQVYRDFPIITAQPEEAEQRGVPHHLYGLLASKEKLCAADWARLAAAKAREIHARGKIPLLVGGTGFYLRALLEGLADLPRVSAETSRKIAWDMERLGSEVLYGRLQKVDPDWAAGIHRHDKQRIMRGLEVWEGTGRSLSWWHRRPQGQPLAAGPCFFMDVPLKFLEAGLLARIRGMLEKGALEEAKKATIACPDMTASAWSAIGCREALWIASGMLGEDECVKRWYYATRAYAKRQLTWFRGKNYHKTRDGGQLLRFAVAHDPFGNRARDAGYFFES